MVISGGLWGGKQRVQGLEVGLLEKEREDLGQVFGYGVGWGRGGRREREREYTHTLYSTLPRALGALQGAGTPLASTAAAMRAATVCAASWQVCALSGRGRLGILAVGGHEWPQRAEARAVVGEREGRMLDACRHRRVARVDEARGASGS